MTALTGTLLILLLVIAWASLGCSALREFSYSRLEDLCEKGGVPDRFRAILKQQDNALLALELLHVTSLLGMGLGLFASFGPPTEWQPLPVAFRVAEYAGCFILLLIVGELIPWTIARVGSEWFLYRFWPAIHFLTLLLQPILSFAKQIDRYAHRLSGRGEPEADDASVIGEEIRTVVDEGRREGVLEQDAGVMIERVMELQDEDVGAIMTPRTDMCCIRVDATLEEARKELLESGHSRMPVIGDSTDDIMGILYAKDLLGALAPDRQPGEPIPILRDLVREPIYVPVTTEIPPLLELMKREHVHIAMVLDEYGGVAGLVTLEDILEEIVGEIGDEYDEKMEENVDVVAVSETVTEVDGRVHLDDLNERFSYALPENQDFDTIGGFVFSLMGRVPTPGEVATWKQLKFTVLEADKRTIKRLRIDLEPATAPTSNGG